MAKASCKVKFQWRDWKRSGYAEVMNGSDCQNWLDKKANKALSQANATFSPDKGEAKGYASKTIKGTLAKGRIIYTQTPHAHNSERKHNRLQNIFGG